MSGEGQVRVRKVRVRSELCKLKDLNLNKDFDLSYKCDQITWPVLFEGF